MNKSHLGSSILYALGGVGFLIWGYQSYERGVESAVWYMLLGIACLVVSAVYLVKTVRSRKKAPRMPTRLPDR